jgi:hypothetical protein
MSYQGPGIYRHYKGHDYLALGLGVEEATLIPVVIYRPHKQAMPDDAREKSGVNPTYWTRPLTDFNAMVPLDTGTADGVPRFTFVPGPLMSDLP